MRSPRIFMWATAGNVFWADGLGLTLGMAPDVIDATRAACRAAGTNAISIDFGRHPEPAIARAAEFGP